MGDTDVARHTMESSAQMPELGRAVVGPSLQLGTHFSILVRWGVALPGMNVDQGSVFMHLDFINQARVHDSLFNQTHHRTPSCICHA